MLNPGRLRDLLLSPVRTRRRAFLTAALLLAAAWPVWYGVRLVRADLAVSDAVRALARYDFAAARQRLAEAARLRPRRPDVWLLSAQAARRDGDPPAAADHLIRYEALVGLSTPEGRLEGLLQRAQAGRAEQDIPYLLALIDSGDPAAEQILEALAVGAVQVYHVDRASFFVDQLLQRFPKNPVGRLIRAQMDDIIGQRDRAAAECRSLVAEFPDNVKARLLLAAQLYKSQAYPEAMAEYEELRRRGRGDPEALLGLARCLDRLGRTDEARPRMRELEERYPDNAEVLLECGRFAAKEDRLADAERLLRRAVEIAPSEHEAHYNLGLCLERVGKTDEARQHLERFKQIEADLMVMQKLLQAVIKTPQDPAPRREMGLICIRNGQTAEGLRWLQGGLEMAPTDRATHEALADFYTSCGDLDRATYHRQRAR